MCAGIQELERGTGERIPFFLYYSQTSSPNRSYNEFYEICIVCWPMHDEVQFSHILGGW